MRGYAEQLCQNGQPLLRRQGCGRALLFPLYSDWGPVPSFDVASGAMIGVDLYSDTGFGPCTRDGGLAYSVYQYGQTVDGSCPSLETCVLCNAHPTLGYPSCPGSAPGVRIDSPVDGVTFSTRDVSIAFSVTEGSGDFSATCQLDSAPPAPCTSPYTFTGIVDGPHTVQVIASNSGGSSRPATVNFAVVTGAGADVKQIATGSNHTCAVLSDGRVRCWGWAGYGQLGYGNINPVWPHQFPTSAGDVNVGGPVVQMAAGFNHTCALLSSGKVRCWGDGSGGKLGYGNTNSIGDDELPSSAGDVNVGGQVVQIAAGHQHTCALLSTGNVRCWGVGIIHNGQVGLEQFGQLGYGNFYSIGDDELPSSAGDVSVGGQVVQIIAGGAHTCALLSTGKVRCWGSGYYGQLGYGNFNSIGEDELPSSAGDVDVGGQVVQIAAGASHTCARLSGGRVRCWGGGGYLGYGHTDTIGDDEFPSSAGDVNVGGAVAEIAAGQEHTCAVLATGSVRCWGNARSGQLGYGNTNVIGDDELPSSAGDVSVGGPVVQLAAGGAHTCALLSSASVRCWGDGGSRQLGYFDPANIGDDELPASAGDVPLLP